MIRKISIITLIFFLISQTILLRLGPTQQSNAAELKGFSVSDVALKDGNGQFIDGLNNPDVRPKRDETVQIIYNWQLSESVTGEEQLAIQLPSQFSNVQEASKELITTDGNSIGTYAVTSDGNLSITLSDKAVEHPNKQGTLTIQAQFNESALSSADTVPITFNLTDLTKTINVVFNSNDSEKDAIPPSDTENETKDPENSTDGKENSNIDESPKDGSEENNQEDSKKEVNEENLQVASNPIQENIITDAWIVNKDGEIDSSKYPNNRPLVGKEVTIYYNLELPNGHKYKAGDTFEFKLPKEFELYNSIDDGILDNFGTFIVTKDGNVKITFNENIENNSDVKGTMEIWSIFSKTTITGSTHQEIKFPLKDETKVIPIDFLPEKGTAISKLGAPNHSYNATEINWEIDINTKLDPIKNAVVKDPLQEGQELQDNSIKVYKLNVNIDGTVKLGEEIDSSKYKIEKTSDGKDFELHFTDETIRDAYRITFTTKITDEEKTYKNEAILSGDEYEEISAEGTVNVGRGEHLVKKAIDYDSSTQTITWEIKYNYNEKTIDHAWLEDYFSNQHELIDKEFKVYQISIDENGNEEKEQPLVNEDLYTLDNINRDGENGFKLTFKNPISSAYKIIYKTKTTDKVFDNGSITNTVTSSDNKKASDKKTITQEVLHKYFKDVNYATKTVDWQITFNRNNFEMNNAQLTDTFINKGLKLVEDSLKIINDKTGETLTFGTDYTLVSNEGENFIITFKQPVKNSYTIKFTTSFNDDWKIDKGETNYTNKAVLTWNDEDGNKKSKEDTATFKPDLYTLKNGFKGGSYNAITKEITWNIGINYNLKPLDHAVVTDTLLNGQKLVDGSIEVRKMTLTGKANGIEVGDPIDKDLYTVNTTIKDSEGNPTVTIIFNKAIAEPYYITFKTTLDGEIVNGSYSNTATLKDGDKKITDLTAKVSVQYGGESVQKKGSQNGKQADWKVTINPSQSHVSNAKIVDKPSTNQILLESSFKLFNTTVDAEGNISKGDLVPKDDYVLKINEDKDGNQTFELSFTKSIDRAYILEYQSYLSAKNGEKASNSVTFTGENKQTIEKETSASFEVRLSGGSGTGSGETGKLIITKVDADEESKLLPGAKFTLYDSEGKIPIKTATTDKDGQIIFNKLLYDNYILKEDSAPEGYVVSIPNGQTVEIKNPEEKMTIKNKKRQQAVELTKVDAGNENLYLPGAEFKLQYKVDEDYVDTDHAKITTDENGKFIIPNLEPGDYKLIETKAPFGYVLNDTGIQFTIVKDQTEITKVTAKNTLKPGGFEITKVDADDPTITLEGAEFELKAADGTIVKSKLTTNKDGKLVVDGLNPGTYQLIETKAPVDYQLLDKPIEITIDKGQETLLQKQVTNKLIPGSVILTKIHKGNSSITLKGAEFKLVNEKGDTVKEKLVTNDQGQIQVDDLRPGKYEFIETKAPSGYMLNTKPLQFEIVKSQEKALQVSFENELIPPYIPLGKVELTKVDSDNPLIVLENAEFMLKDQNGSIIKDGLTTNKDGKIFIENLYPGTYQLIETKAPKGYVLDEKPITFTISNNPIDVLKITATNKMITGAVELIKIDKDDKHLKLAGAEFTLETKSGTVIQKGLKTNSEGKLEVSNLKPGDYKFIETKAPVGYVLNPKPIEFTIGISQKEKVQITFKNEKAKINDTAKGSVELLKVDDKNHSIHLENAVFILKDENGKNIASDLTTNKQGKLVLKDLKPGQYQFIETKAPKNYKLDTTPIEFTIGKDHNTSIQLVVENEKQPKDDDEPNTDDPGNDPGDDPGTTPDKDPGSNQGNDPKNGNGNQTDATKDKNKPNNHFQLPNTATNMYSWLFIGTILLIISSVFLILGRRKAE